MLMLNETSAFLINELKKQAATDEELALRLAENYEVDMEVARRDVQELLRQLEEQGVAVLE